MYVIHLCARQSSLFPLHNFGMLRIHPKSAVRTWLPNIHAEVDDAQTGHGIGENILRRPKSYVSASFLNSTLSSSSISLSLRIICAVFVIAFRRSCYSYPFYPHPIVVQDQCAHTPPNAPAAAWLTCRTIDMRLTLMNRPSLVPRWLEKGERELCSPCDSHPIWFLYVCGCAYVFRQHNKPVLATFEGPYSALRHRVVLPCDKCLCLSVFVRSRLSATSLQHNLRQSLCLYV